jgi:hypothetical protein
MKICWRSCKFCIIPLIVVLFVIHTHTHTYIYIYICNSNIRRVFCNKTIIKITFLLFSHPVAASMPPASHLLPRDPASHQQPRVCTTTAWFDDRSLSSRARGSRSGHQEPPPPPAAREGAGVGARRQTRWSFIFRLEQHRSRCEDLSSRSNPLISG